MEIHNRNRAIKVGVTAFMIFATLLIALIFYIIGSNQKIFDNKYPLYMFLPNVQALEPGAFVTLSGLKVGVVGNLEFSEKDDTQGILIQLKIAKTYKEKITTSSIATIKTMGILGDKYVDITLGNLADPILQDNDYIRANPPLDADAVIAMANNTMNSLQQTLAQVSIIANAAVQGEGMLGLLIKDPAAKQTLMATLNNLRNITSRVAAGRGTAGKMIQDTTLFHSIQTTMASLENISTKIDRGEGSLGKMVNDTTFYGRFTSITERTDVLLSKLNSNEGTAGKLINDAAMYDQLLELNTELADLIKDFKANPKKYVSLEIF